MQFQNESETCNTSSEMYLMNMPKVLIVLCIVIFVLSVLTNILYSVWFLLILLIFTVFYCIYCITVFLLFTVVYDIAILYFLMSVLHSLVDRPFPWPGSVLDKNCVLKL